MTINTFTDKTSKIVNKLVWLIPIRSIRDNIRDKMNNNIINLYYYINYQSYKDKVKNKKTFFVRNNLATNEKDFYNAFFYNVIKNNFIPDLEISYNPDIEFFSCIGPRYFLETSKAKIKIFYTEECISKNTIWKIWSQYSDNCINDVDLSLGFDRLDENKYKNYIRYPFWINNHFNTIGGGGGF